MEQNSNKRHCGGRIDLGYCFGRPDGGGDTRKPWDEMGRAGRHAAPDKLEPEDATNGEKQYEYAHCMGGGESHPHDSLFFPCNLKARSDK